MKKARTVKSSCSNLASSQFLIRVVIRLAKAICFIALLPGAANAQMRLPVRIVATNAIYDEYGNIMKGSAAMDVSERNLVQILWASNSVIYPPAYNGSPDPRNPPVENGECTIGNLISPSIAEPGRFCALLANPRPLNGSKFFARVYNAPTIAQASFYTDSQVMTVKDNEIQYARFVSPVQPIDPRDDDGDGLNNSWEKSLDSDPANPDTDGDGMTDYEEFLTGTDLLDEHSFFATVWINTDKQGNAWLTWSSVAGKRYQVQYTDEAHPGEYVDLGGVVTATSDLTQVLIEGGATNNRRFYRVKLIVQ